jgi:recombination protein RecT
MSDTAIATAPTKTPHPIIVLRDYLVERQDSLRNALPPHIKPERFISAVMTSVQINPDLLACDRRSLWLSCLKCAQDGLIPDGTEAAIVPFKKIAQYMPMYQGYLKKFRNSGQFKWITAGIVYEGETFEHWIDETGEHFKHIPSNDNDDRKAKRVYALATTKDGGSFIADLSITDINKRRAMSRASREDAPWKMWTDEMMKKTALRVLSKLLPKSSDVDVFVQRDEAEALGVQTTETIADARGEAFGSALEHFAESSPASEANTLASENSGRPQETSSSAEQHNSASPAAAAAQAGASEIDAIGQAYERGKQARIDGHQRKALPGEYRDGAHQREADAWHAGFDGAERPSSGAKLL